jgi:DNA-binding transcriptional LysR family regulator
MHATLDDLVSMATFAEVVRVKNFSAAARQLGVSKSAVSRRVAALEARLGVRLLQRTTRRIALTEAGQQLFERCSRLLSEADDAAQVVSELGGAARGLLRVNAPEFLGYMFIVPLLPAFQAEHPGLAVELSLSDRMVDPIEESYDLTIRVARLQDSSLTSRRLGQVRLVVVGSSDYLRRQGTPKSPGELARHACLRFTRLAPRDEWRFKGPSGEVPVNVTGPFSTNNAHALQRAAVAGVGLAVLPRFYVAEELATGALVEVLNTWVPEPKGIWAIHAHGRQPPAKVRAFVDFLSAKWRGHDW